MAPQFIYVMKALTKVVPPSRVILKDIWLSFYPGAKIGVLGANGAGKSSLLRIMAGVDHDYNGEAWAAQGTKIGYLSQEPELDPAKISERSTAEACCTGITVTSVLVGWSTLSTMRSSRRTLSA